jgi:hypothetical protein
VAPPHAVHAGPGWHAPALSAASGPWLPTSYREPEEALGAHTCGQMDLQGRRPGRERIEGWAGTQIQFANQTNASGPAATPAL